MATGARRLITELRLEVDGVVQEGHVLVGDHEVARGLSRARPTSSTRPDAFGPARGPRPATARSPPRCRARCSSVNVAAGDRVEEGEHAGRHGGDEDGARLEGAVRRHRHRASTATAGEQVDLGATLFVVEPATDSDGEDAGVADAVKRTPQVVSDPALPTSVTIYEVGPRDGLQNEDAIVPVEIKAEFIRRLVAAGLQTIEVTSFVHPRWVPQLADAEQLVDCDRPDLGAEDARARAERARPGSGARQGRSATSRSSGRRTETFAQRNLNRSLDEQFTMFEPVVARARDAGMRVRGYVSMCFGDPWEGDVPVDQVVSVGRRLLDLGCDELSLGDTIGVAHAGPRRGAARRLHGGRAPARPARDALPRHLRPGTVQRADRAAARRHDLRRVGGRTRRLSRTPRAPPATSRPRIWSGSSHGLGIETGVDLEALVATSVWMAEQIGKPPASRVVAALGATSGA